MASPNKLKRFFGGKQPRSVNPGTYNLTVNSIKSGAEFGAGSSASALIRRAFEPLIFPNASHTLHNRLSERLRAIIRSGPEELKGSRRVTDGNVELLRDFQFNCYQYFSKVARLHMQVKIDPAGEVVVILEHFELTKVFSTLPPNVNTATLRICVGIFDFDNRTYQLTEADDLLIDLEHPFFAGGRLGLPIAGMEGKVVLVAASVFFSIRKDAHISIRKDRRHTAGKILDAAYILNGKRMLFTPAGVPAEKIPVIPPFKNMVKWKLG